MKRNQKLYYALKCRKDYLLRNKILTGIVHVYIHPENSKYSNGDLLNMKELEMQELSFDVIRVYMYQCSN